MLFSFCNLGPALGCYGAADMRFRAFEPIPVARLASPGRSNRPLGIGGVLELAARARSISLARTENGRSSLLGLAGAIELAARDRCGTARATEVAARARLAHLGALELAARARSAAARAHLASMGRLK